MSISSISGASSLVAGSTSPFQQRRQDFQALAQALSSGDLSGAQSAFAALQQLAQTGANGTGGSTSSVTGAAATTAAGAGNSGSPLASDWAALSSALSTNNLSAAQSAFAQLQSDFRSQLASAAGNGNVGTLNVAGPSGVGGSSATARAHHGGHHHHHASTDASSTASTTGTSTDPDGDDDSTSALLGSLLNVTA